MQVTNVTVGYDRKRQPAQYESAGAKVEFSAVLSATVGDTEDHVAVAKKLLGEARVIVLTEIGLMKATTAAAPEADAHAAKEAAFQSAQSGEPAKAVEPVRSDPPPADPKPAEAAHGTTGRRKKKDEAPAATPPATVTDAAGIPADPAPASTTKAPETALGRPLPAHPAQQTAAAAAADIPLDDGPAVVVQPATAAQAAQAAPQELTANAVQKFITQCLVAKKFLPQVVLELMKKNYQTDRVYDLKPDQLAEFYEKLKALAA